MPDILEPRFIVLLARDEDRGLVSSISGQVWTA